MNYDVHFALRLCHENKLTKACVFLSGLLGLWESAVDLALTVSVDKAIELANMSPENDVELKKKLWLKIGKFRSNFVCFKMKFFEILKMNYFSTICC